MAFDRIQLNLKQKKCLSKHYLAAVSDISGATVERVYKFYIVFDGVCWGLHHNGAVGAGNQRYLKTIV